MAKTARRETPSSKQLGRHLRQVRRKQGLSRAEVARSAGLTRRELTAYERGRIDVPESDLWCLAGSCGVDVSELLPSRDPLHVSSDLSSLAVGDSIRHLREPGEPDGLLREYLAMIYELRNLPPGSRVPLREPDLMALADALGGTPEAIEQKLVELIGASREEAARLRAMILPPLSLPAALSTPPSTDPYSTITAPTSGDAVDAFFAAPRAEDPFAPPPPLVPDAPLAPESFDILPADPFAPPPSSAPVAAGPAPADPALVPPLTEPFATLDAPVAPAPMTATEPPLGAPVPPDPSPFAAGTPTITPLAGWGADRPLPDGLVVDHGVPDAPPSPADPFAPPAPTLPPLEGYVAPDDPFGFGSNGNGATTNGNGHHDATAIVELPVQDVATDPETDAEADERDGYVSDTPLLAESSVLDPDADLLDPALDAVIDEMVSNAAAPPTITPEPEIDEPLDVVLGDEPPVLDLGIDVAPDPLDDVAPISWSAQDAPVATPTVAAAPPRFEQVGANWRVGGMAPATAAADDGALAIRRADARWALADIDAPGDFTIDATVDFTAGTGFGIVFRAATDSAERLDGYSFDIDTVAAGGGYLLRQWEGGRQHWRPLAHAPVADPTHLYGRRAVQVVVHGDHLTVTVDGELVLSVPGLSRASVALGRTPCRGGAVGVQASATTDLTVDAFRIAR